MRKTLLVVVVLAVLTAGVLLLARHERYDWSTGSPAALAEFEAGLQALGKLYFADAVDHYERALVADPEFAAAQLYLMQALNRLGAADPQRIGELVAALRSHDLERLNARERALVSHYLARIDGDYERAYRIVDDYLAERPEDPFILELRCLSGPLMEHPEKVEACLEELIEIDPNRVQAQNMLAYMAFDRGDFQGAEERFKVYGYLAPDQANPHDSFGELLMVTGRYEAAEEEFRRAVAMKHDFCPSWNNLVTVHLLRRDAAAAARTVEELDAAGGCPEEQRPYQRCRVELWTHALAGRWQEALDTSRQECAPYAQEADALVLTVRAALATGNPAAAEEAIEGVADWFRRERGAVDPRREVPFVALLAGLTASAGGELERAAEALAHADKGTAWGSAYGTRKLYTRLERAAALAAAGEEGEAAGLMASLAAVNRPFAEAPPLAPLHPVPAPPPAPDPEEEAPALVGGRI